MKLLPAAILTLLASASLLSAQAQTLRGKVEDVPSTANQFFLSCTDIPLVSSALNLNAWVGLEAILNVVNVGTVAAPVLRVDAATATTPIFDMGNLRPGQSTRWQIHAAAGSFGMMFLDFTTNTGFAPFGSSGTWLLGSNAPAIAAGITNGANVFEINFPVPNFPPLLGTSFTGQGVVFAQGTLTLGNPDCKVYGQ